MDQNNEAVAVSGFPKILKIGLVIIALVLGADYLIGTFFGRLANSCEELTPGVASASKGNNAGQGGAFIIDIVEVSELFSKDGELDCSGLAILSNGYKQRFNFKQHNEYDKWWVKFSPAGPPFLN